MMLLNPGFALAGVLGAVTMLALHFLVRRRPPSMLFATARFVPAGRVITTSWDRRPSDIMLAALRALSVLLAGLALANPVLRPDKLPVSRVILADRSRAVADPAEVDDSVAAVFRSGDIVIAFDSAAVRDESPQDTVSAAGTRRGSLSAALVAAVRSASALRARADSIELVVVSPFATEEVDAATLRIREEWPGRARLVQVAGKTPAAARGAVTLSADAGDPLRVALPALAARGPSVRVVRGEAMPEDSAWARESDHVLVRWPVTAAPLGFGRRSPTDTSAGVAGKASAVLGQFERRWRVDPRVSGTVVASWVDGQPAAIEIPTGAGCVRSVAVPVAAAGDLVLREEFRSFVGEMLGPCGGRAAFGVAPSQIIARLAGSGSLAPASAFDPPANHRSPARPWLLLAALVALLLELALRGRERKLGVESPGELSPEERGERAA